MTESQIDRLEKILNSDNPEKVTIRPDGTVEELEASAPVPADSPVRKAWDRYVATFSYGRSKGWALQIAPITHSGAPDQERIRRFEIMPLTQRETHVEGALWSAFYEGFEAGRAAREAEISQDTEQGDQIMTPSLDEIARRAEARRACTNTDILHSVSHLRNAEKDVAALLSRLREAEARVERMREALEPFASRATNWEPSAHDDMQTGQYLHISLGDLRRARAALAQKEGG